MFSVNTHVSCHIFFFVGIVLFGEHKKTEGETRCIIWKMYISVSLIRLYTWAPRWQSVCTRMPSASLAVSCTFSSRHQSYTFFVWSTLRAIKRTTKIRFIERSESMWTCPSLPFPQTVDLALWLRDIWFFTRAPWTMFLSRRVIVLVNLASLGYRQHTSSVSVTGMLIMCIGLLSWLLTQEIRDTWK